MRIPKSEEGCFTRAGDYVRVVSASRNVGVDKIRSKYPQDHLPAAMIGAPLEKVTSGYKADFENKNIGISLSEQSSNNELVEDGDKMKFFLSSMVITCS